MTKILVPSIHATSPNDQDVVNLTLLNSLNNRTNCWVLFGHSGERSDRREKASIKTYVIDEILVTLTSCRWLSVQPMLCRSGVQQLPRWILGLWPMPSRFPWKWYQLSWHEWGANFEVYPNYVDVNFFCTLSLFTFHSFLVWHGVWCLLQSQWKAALHQHRSGFPLSTLSQALQGQPAFRHGCGGCQEKQTGEPNRQITDWMHLMLWYWRKRFWAKTVTIGLFSAHIKVKQ